MALGASPGTVMGLVLRQGLALAIAGAGAGLLGALLVTRLLSKLLYGVTPTDPATFGIAVLLLLAVAGVASWLPARRAARTDPMLALRQE